MSVDRLRSLLFAPAVRPEMLAKLPATGADGVVIGISVHETTLGTTVANLGFEEITFPPPALTCGRSSPAPVTP